MDFEALGINPDHVRCGHCDNWKSTSIGGQIVATCADAHTCAADEGYPVKLVSVDLQARAANCPCLELSDAAIEELQPDTPARLGLRTGVDFPRSLSA